MALYIILLKGPRRGLFLMSVVPLHRRCELCGRPECCIQPTTSSDQPQAYHPGGNPGANLKSISLKCYLQEVAFEWELTEQTIYLPLGCLQGGLAVGRPVQNQLYVSLPSKRCRLYQKMIDWKGSETFAFTCYRGLSIIRNSHPLGPYGRPMPGALGGS